MIWASESSQSSMIFPFLKIFFLLLCPHIDMHPHEATVAEDAESLQMKYNANIAAREKGNFPRCGEPDNPISGMRPCPEDDSFCGHWVGRFWHPVGCRYDDVTSDQARKCLGNRTLAFMGDSMTRDLFFSVSLLLLGGTMGDTTNEKFAPNHPMVRNMTIYPKFNSWPHSPATSYHYNGYFYPSIQSAFKNNHGWQVQYWHLFRNEFHQDGQARKVFNNEMRKEFSALHRIDLGFWNHGLHDYGWWDKPPHGEKYVDQIVGQWLRIREKVKAPTVWLSMNSECLEKLNEGLLKDRLDTQAAMVTEANKYVNVYMKAMKLPYWDADQALRTADRCSLLGDGLHVKMWVDFVRAKMLFTILCDEDFNWRGSPDLFV